MLLQRLRYTLTVYQLSPTLRGFRIMFRRPTLGFAEIAWRWSVGAATGSIAVIVLVEYLDSLTVTTGDRLLLFSRRPILVGQAVYHIFHGTAPRLLSAGLAVALALAVAWVIIASLSRAAILCCLVGEFEHGVDSARGTRAQSLFDNDASDQLRIRSLIALNCLRVATTLAAAVGCVGALLLPSSVPGGKSLAPALTVQIVLFLLTMVWLAWTVLNWVLSVAAVFVASNGYDALRACSSAIDLCRKQTGPVVAVASWFGLAHLAVFLGASFFAVTSLGMAGIMPRWAIILTVALITILYFAVVDFLYIGRLAAYVAILNPQFPPQPSAIPHQPLGSGTTPLVPPAHPRIDPDQLILSDTSPA